MTDNRKKSAVVICPGRGTYNRDELGYLSQHHRNQRDFIDDMDDYRQAQGQITVSELDSTPRFSLQKHTSGDNASALIFTCALADFLSIDRDHFDIVAITGNSMGWYLALAAGGACSLTNGMRITNTMGTLMHNHAEGAQLVYPMCDDNWQYDPKQKETLEKAIDNARESYQIFNSINLGMMAVIAGEKQGIDFLANTLPKVERYPLVLPNHAAFHTPLMEKISDQGKAQLPLELLSSPNIPLIDGRGHIWQPYTSDRNALYNYTFNDQVCQTYNYSKAVDVACKEFAPDCLIVLGPGSTLGAPTAQQLIHMRWRHIVDKQSFKSLQNENPFILSMGLENQRALVTNFKRSAS